MGTTFSVVVARLPSDVTLDAVESVVADVLLEADRHLSGWNARSELARFNAAATTEWQDVSPVLLEVAGLAQGISRATGGAFDPTVAPLVAAWGFGAQGAAAAAPAAEHVARLRQRVGYDRLELRARPPGLRKKLPDLTIDLDAIAPGWAVDRIAARIEALGIADYIVELGGEVRARGHHPRGRAWRVAVETPLAGERRAHTVIELDGRAVSTSGDYRDHRELDGQRVSHTIDPRSGVPVAHGLASVTVVHASAAQADAWATALMVLGPEQGLALARRNGLAALFIRRDARSGELLSTETPEFARLRVAPGARL
jgi:thiamine biosynthesis lipoprotein